MLRISASIQTYRLHDTSGFQRLDRTDSNGLKICSLVQAQGMKTIKHKEAKALSMESGEKRG